MLRTLALGALLVLDVTAASAQEAISTAPSAPPPDASKEPPPRPLGEATLIETSGVTGPCGPGPRTRPAADGSQAPDHNVHGEVTATAGTHGYRAVSASACKSLGDTGFVAVNVGQGHIGRR